MSIFDDLANVINRASSDEKSGDAKLNDSMWGGIVDGFKVISDVAIKYETAKSTDPNATYAEMLALMQTQQTTDVNPNQAPLNDSQLLAYYQNQLNSEKSGGSDNIIKLVAAVAIGWAVAGAL